MVLLVCDLEEVKMNSKQLFEDGYSVFSNVVPKTLLDGVKKDILDVLDIPDVIDGIGMIELYHTQSMWDIRQYPVVHEVFSSLFKDEKLWVSMDRVSYKMSNVASKFIVSKYDNGFIHWDICVNQFPRTIEFQGVLALEDTDENMGGFQCVPSLYRELDSWLSSLPTKKAIYSQFEVLGDEAIEYIPKFFPKREPRKWKIEKVPLKAGDLVIWDSFLPHGNGSNKGDNPRIAQYITMFPEGDARLRKERVNCWKYNKIPSGYAFPGNPYIKCKDEPAKLTELGRKLVGVDRW